MIRTAYTQRSNNFVGLLSFIVLFLSGCAVVGADNQTVDQRKESVRNAIMVHSQNFLACYHNYLAGGGDQEGKMFVKFTLDERANISDLRVDAAASQIHNETFSSCLTENLSQIKMPPAALGTVLDITFPMMFRR